MWPLYKHEGKHDCFNAVENKDTISFISITKPFYHEAGKILKEDESVKPDRKIALAKVDATIETELASRFQLQGYPTIKIFRKGVAYEYDGPRRDGQGILSFKFKINQRKKKKRFFTYLSDC